LTSLDDFEKFVTDAETGAQFQAWARDNHGGKDFTVDNPSSTSDLGKWYIFRDAIRAGQRPGIPVMSTPHGRELIDGGVLYLDINPIPAPPPPPPAPTGKNVGNGYAANLQGSTYAQMSDTERAHYGGVIVGFGDEINIANFAKAHPVVHGFGYQTSVEMGSNNWYGAVLIDEARAKGWVLKTASGAEVTNGYGLLMADIGNPDYQTAWCNYEKARAATTGLKSKFLDNVTGVMMAGSQALTGGEGAEREIILRAFHPEGGEDHSERVVAATHFGAWFSGTPINPRTKQPYTDATWQTDYISFLKAQQTQLPDFYRLANAYAGDRLGWWKTIAPFVDGLMLEYYDGGSGHNACLAACVAAGKDPWVIVDPSHGQPGPDTAAGIALAAAFQAATAGRKGGGFAFNGVNVWRDNAGSWTSKIS
jgi:hypothetical protein